jgi:hypothetical protein
MNGLQLIAIERDRQVRLENWTAEHDDTHTNGQLPMAAACYVMFGGGTCSPLMWPFASYWWKPGDGTPDSRIRSLAKAGALIAAEIDRIQRAMAALDEKCAIARAGVDEPSI